jgi:hypothetical protein
MSAAAMRFEAAMEDLAWRAQALALNMVRVTCPDGGLLAPPALYTFVLVADAKRVCWGVTVHGLESILLNRFGRNLRINTLSCSTCFQL